MPDQPAVNNGAQPRKKRRRKQWADSPWERAAKRGDLDKIFELAAESPFIEFPFVLQHGSQAIEQLAKKDPALLVETMLRRILTLQGKLLVRVEANIANGLKAHDRHNPHGDVPPAIANEWLPRLGRLQMEIREMAKAYASVKHTLTLTQLEARRTARSSKSIIRLADVVRTANGTSGE